MPRGIRGVVVRVGVLDPGGKIVIPGVLVLVGVGLFFLGVGVAVSEGVGGSVLVLVAVGVIFSVGV